jgi:hypothetical protein
MKTPEELIRDVLKRYGGEAKASDLLRPLWGKLNAAAIKSTVEGMDDVEMWTEKSTGRGAPKMMYRLIEGQDEEPKQPEAKVIDIDHLRGKTKPTQNAPVNVFEGLI